MYITATNWNGTGCAVLSSVVHEITFNSRLGLANEKTVQEQIVHSHFNYPQLLNSDQKGNSLQI